MVERVVVEWVVVEKVVVEWVLVEWVVVEKVVVERVVVEKVVLLGGLSRCGRASLVSRVCCCVPARWSLSRADRDCSRTNDWAALVTEKRVVRVLEEVAMRVAAGLVSFYWWRLLYCCVRLTAKKQTPFAST